MASKAGKSGVSPVHTPKNPPPSTQTLTLGMLQEALKTMQGEINQKFEESNQKTKEFNQKIQESNQKLEEKLEGKFQAVLEEIAVSNQQFKEKISTVLQGIAQNTEIVDQEIAATKQITENLVGRVGETENQIEKDQMEITMLQYRSMEFAIRVRGVKEKKQENLKEIMLDALVQTLGATKEVLDWQIDKIYRVNSWVARQRNLPRDIVIYFTSRSLRNGILQATFLNKLQVEGQEVMVLKEIPPKMLRARKDFAFLVTELKKQKIQYRWEVPAGVAVTYLGARYRINTVIKAKDFLENVLKARKPTSPEKQGAEKDIQGGGEEVLTVFSEGGASSSALLISLDESNPITSGTQEMIKEQRMTRAATRRLQQHQSQSTTQETAKTEVVGGARPKQKVDVQAMLQSLWEPKDGK